MSAKDMRENRADVQGTPRMEDTVEFEDTALEQALRGAYQAMDPTPETQARMLAALKAAQAARTGADADSAGAQADGSESAAGEAAGGHPAFTPVGHGAQGWAEASKRELDETPDANANAKRARRRIAPWKVALPAAACLALAAIGIGVAVNQPGMDEAPLVMEEATEDGLMAEEKLYDMASSDDAAAGDALNSSRDAGQAMELDAAAPEGAQPETAGVLPQDNWNTEEYNAVEEAPFTATATSPLSTVSADVDTASYANLRRMLYEGYSLDDIPAGAVRIEEMLNYFDYSYASPTGDDRFSMQTRVGTCPWNPDTQLLVLGFATAKEAAEKPANLVFLIDVSGSMDEPDKLELLQDSFSTLLEHLDGDDRVSIVTYSGQEEVVLEGAHGDDGKAIMRAIYRLRADGSTNGEAGLKMAYEVAERNKIEGGVNRIVMASDGDLNVGMTSESDLYRFVEGKRDTGIYLSVLGFGAGNYKDNKMETLADHGNGQYHYIDCIEEAERVLSKKLAQSIVPFADDVKAQVEFNPATVKGYRLVGYENRTLADADFLDDAKDAGDVGPNAQFTVAYEIIPAGSPMEVAVPDLKYSDAGAGSGARDAAGELATCSLRYRALDDGTVHQQELAVLGNEGTDADWAFASAVIEFGMLARGSAYAGTATLQGILDTLAGLDLSEERWSLVDLVETAQQSSRGLELDELSPDHIS